MNQYAIIIKFVIYAAVLAIGISIGYGLRDMSAKAKESELLAVISGIKAASEKAAKSAAEKALKDQQDLADHLAAIDKQYMQRLRNEKIKHDRILADIISGNRRLSIAAGSCTGMQSDKTTETGSMDNGGKRAELDRSHASRIIGITIDGDEAIEQLSACQETIKKYLLIVNKDANL